MRKRRLLPLAIACLALTACDWLHEGPRANDIDSAVRRALDAANKGPLNALAGNPLPTSADVASVKSDGDCAKTATNAFACHVSIARRAAAPNEEGTTLHAELVFAKDADGHWQTSDVDQALAVGAAKSLIDRVNQALPDHAASNPSW